MLFNLATLYLFFFAQYLTIFALLKEISMSTQTPVVRYFTWKLNSESVCGENDILFFLQDVSLNARILITRPFAVYY